MRALTGTDPDRLKEEKERGITIDLGFAHAELGRGRRGLVRRRARPRALRPQHAGRRPRHRRGAAGGGGRRVGDAADARALPHLPPARRARAASSRSPSATWPTPTARRSPSWRRASSWPGSFLEGRPVVRVSRGPARGCPRCARRSSRSRARPPPRPAEGLLRLPVDRVFTMKGFGTVVTGTLVGRRRWRWARRSRRCPPGRRARVRGLQVHGETRRAGGGRDAHGGQPGRRRGRGPRARRRAGRGPGRLRATSMLDVELSLLPGAQAARGRRARARPRRRAPRPSPACGCSRPSPLEPGRRGARPAAARARRRRRARRPARAALLLAGRHDRRRRRRGPAAAAAARRRPRRRSSGCATPPACSARRRPCVAEAGAAGIEAPLLAARLTVPLARAGRRRSPASGAVVALGQDPAVVVSRERPRAAAASGARGARRRTTATNPLQGRPCRARSCGRRAFGDAAGDRVRARARPTSPRRGACGSCPTPWPLARHEVRLIRRRGGGAPAARWRRRAAAGLAGVELAGAGRERSQRDAKLLERVARVLVDRARAGARGRGPARRPGGTSRRSSCRCASAGRRARRSRWGPSRS